MTFLLRTLGDSIIETDAGHRVDVPPGKPFALLVHLAMERRPVRRDRLAQLLWPGSPRERALQSVRQAVWLLRRTLGEDVLVGGDPLDLARDRVVTDVDRLRAELGSGAHGAALALWRGRFLERFALADAPGWDAWVEELAALVSTEMAAGLHHAASAELAGGRPEEAAALLFRAVEIEPFEPRHRLELIRLLIDLRELDRAGQALADARRDVGDLGLAGELDALDARLQQALRRRADDADPALGRPELVGRAAELAEMTRLWRLARDGRAAAALVHGPTGIGKTRLTEELGGMVERDGGRVVVVKATAPERSLPLGFATLLARRLLQLPGSRGITNASDAALRSLLPSLADAATTGAPGIHPTVFADALLDLVGAVAFESPLCIVLDDVHWADDASLAVIARVLRQVRSEPVLLVATWRPEDLSADSQRALHHVSREEMVRAIHLRALSEPEIGELLGLMLEFGEGEAVDRLVETLYRLTGGNPLFIIEVLQALHEEGVLIRDDTRWLLRDDRIPDDVPLPRSLGAAIERRLERLSEPAGRVAAALAGLPPRAGVMAMKGAAGLPEPALLAAINELVERDIACWREGRLEFTHDQQRDAVLRRWAPTVRRGRRRQGLLVATVLLVLLGAAATWASARAGVPEPLFGGGEVYLWFGDTALIAAPPRVQGDPWAARPLDVPAPPGQAGRATGPFLLASGERRWYRTPVEADASPWVVEWRPDGSERVIARFDRIDTGGGWPSPDGRFVAWIMDDSTTTAYDMGLVIGRADGSEPRRVTSGSPVAGWSADGDWIAAAVRGRGADTLVLLTPFGERDRAFVVPEAAWVLWCGEERLAFGGPADGPPTLNFLDVESGAVVPYHGVRPDAAPYVCSPDGSILIGSLIRDDHMEAVAIDLASGREIPFAPGVHGALRAVTWVPDRPARVLDRVEIDPAPDTLAWGGRARLTARAVDHGGRTLDAPIRWATLDPGILGVREDGSIVGNRPGTARVVAVAGAWRSDTARIVVGHRFDSNELVFADTFAVLDTARWWTIGTPVAEVVRREGRPALLISGDGNWADGIALREPLHLPRGLTAELEFRLRETGHVHRYVQIALVDGEPTRAHPETIEDWNSSSFATATVPGRPGEDDATVSIAVLPIQDFERLPPGTDLTAWNRIALRVQPDGTTSLLLNDSAIATGRMRIQDFGSKLWTVAILGGAVGSELLVRDVRVWSVAR